MWQRLLGFTRGHPVVSSLAAVLLLAGVVLVGADALLAGPARTWAERTVNSNLKGYTVRIARARPHLYKLALALDGLVLTQNSHPDPPVADFASLEFTLQWSRLIRFQVAGDLILRRPALHINLAQIQEAAARHVSLKEEGWQNAVEAIYPFKLDQVRIQDGSLLYLAAAPTSKPLQLTGVAMLAQNIHNKAAAPGTYPSPVTFQAALFDTGRVGFTGAADFLREPNGAAMGEIRLERVPLDRLGPLAQDYNLRTTGGLLSASGNVEYTPEIQKIHLAEVLFEDLRVDYITSTATKAQEEAHARQAVNLAREVRNSPRVVMEVDSLRMTRSEIGFINEAARPPYRLFMSDVGLKLSHLSNQANQGRSGFHAQGTFMGSGKTVLSGGFLSTAKPADFAVQLRLDDARLTDLNPFLLGQTGVDVAGGLFSVYTELTVKGGQVEGYFKPLIRNLRISDKRKDRAKPLGKRMEMHVLQWMANFLKNRSSKQVATVTRISGSTRDPRLSEWEALRKLLGNGLFRAILPGFLDRGKAGAQRPPRKMAILRAAEVSSPRSTCWGPAVGEGILQFDVRGGGDIDGMLPCIENKRIVVWYQPCLLLFPSKGTATMSRLTTRDGTEIYFKDWGAGIPVVFSHGWPLSADAWDGQMVFLEALGFRCIAHDRRGHGRSSQPSNGNDMDTYADDLAELIETLDLKGVHLVGHSAGGGEVARYIGRHGTQRIAKAVLVGAVTPLMLRTEAHPGGLPLAVFDGIRAGVTADRSQFFKDLSTTFYGTNRPGAKVSQGVRDAFWLQGLQGGLMNQLACIKAFSETDFTMDLKRFDIPTLLIHGDDDQIVPIGLSSQVAVGLIRDATLKVYPGGSHGLADTCKDALNADLAAFLQP